MRIKQYQQARFLTGLLAFALISLAWPNQALLAAEPARVSQSRITRQAPVDDTLSQTNFPAEAAAAAVQHIDNEILIKFADWTPPSIKQATLSELGAVALGQGRQSFDRWQVNLRELRQARQARDPGNNDDTSDLSLSDVLKSLSDLPFVEWAEPNYIAQALELPSALPNDPYYPLQWNLQLIGADKAWSQARGAGVTVAVVDTGVAYEQWSKYRQASDLSQSYFVDGYNVINHTSHANDDNGHGTHVAGTIAGSTNNHEGVAGLSYEAKLMPVKVLDRSGAGTYSDISEGIIWATDNGADIINLSLGGPVSSQALREAVAYAHERNVLVVAAAGNSGDGEILYPAAYNEYVLSVGAARYDKQRASYSNYGSGLDLLAPGGDIRVDQNSDGYADGILQQTLQQAFWGANPSQFNFYFYQGTSMAAPHAAGVAALVKSLGVSDLAEIKQILLESAEDLGAPDWDKYTGYGLVRADQAMELALQHLESRAENQEDTSNAPSNSPAETTQTATDPAPSDPSGPAPDPAPEPEEETPTEPAPEEEPVQEPTLAKMTLEAALYNLWSRPDTSFSFWEKAVLGINIADQNQQPLGQADLTIEVFNSANKLVAQGAGASDAEGELWLDLGNFAKGTYELVVTAAKQGWVEAVAKIGFRFR